MLVSFGMNSVQGCEGLTLCWCELPPGPRSAAGERAPLVQTQSPHAL